MSISSSGLLSVYAQLTSFANLSNFWDLFETAFGSSYDSAKAATFKYQWQNQNFSQFPQIEIVSSDVLGSAKGAYAISTNRIYLSDQFVSSASQQSLEAVILEEFGHFVDAQVNATDTPGDEGELFSALVRGVNLSAAELGRIKTENDHANIVINNQSIQIEQARSVASGDNRIDSLLSGYKWGVTDITFSFYSGGSYYGTQTGLGVVSDGIKNNVRNILINVIAPLINLNFIEVPDSDSSYGQIRYLLSTTTSYAETYEPFSTDTNQRNAYDVAGDVFLNDVDDNKTDNNGFQGASGTNGYMTLIHETLHALGLKHPNNYDSTGTAVVPPYLPYGEDNWDNSLMSYNDYSGANPSMPMPYDVLALQHLYGAKSFNSTDTTYAFTNTGFYFDGLRTVGSSILPNKLTIWDSGGTDTLDFSSLGVDASGYRFDLNPGGWLSIKDDFNREGYDVNPAPQVSFTKGKKYTATTAGTRLAYEVTIENLVNSSSNDYIIANSAANVFSGYGLSKPTGADTIEGANNLDTLDLSAFTVQSVTQTQSGNNLLLGISSGGSITIKDYYAVPSASRIQIKFANWIRLLGSSDYDRANAMTTGTDGFIYVSGYTNGNLDGQTNNGGADAFVTKYDTNGNKIWTKLLGGSSFDSANAMTTGTDGSIYVSGFTQGNLDGQTNNGGAFVTKYDTSGNKIWTKGSVVNPTFINPILRVGDNSAKAMTTGTDGSIYVSGSTTVEWSSLSYSWSSYDAFVTKYDTSGNKIWTKLLGGIRAYAYAMTTGTDGSIYVSGLTWGNLDGQTNNGGDDAFVTKYDTSGNKIWTKLLGGSSDDYAYGMTTGTDGSIYVSGLTRGNLDGQTNNGKDDAFVTKYDTSGNKIWTKLLGGSSFDSASAMTTGTDGSIYVSGYINGNLDGQTNNGSDDAFVTKYDTNGNKIWTKLLGGSSFDSASAMTTGTDGSIYVSGLTNGNLLYGQTNNGGVDAFVIKFNNPITLAVSPSSVTEDGPTSLVYTFTRTFDTTKALTVNYSIAGTADSTDYTGATPGTGKTITFAAGSDTATLTIDPTADTTVEANETVSLTLATGTGYTIGTSTAVTGTITNDDLPSITLAVAPASVTEDGTINLVYTFTRTGPTTNALTVNYGITGTADATDYTGATPGIGKTITFAAGSATATLTIDPATDTTVEANETVSLTLATGTGYTIGTSTAVTGTITNDDLATINLNPNGQTVVEGSTNPQILSYNVTLSSSSTQVVTVQYSTANGTALAGSDYTATTGTLTFNPGVTSQTINIPILSDSINEANETFTLTLTSPINAALGATKTVTTTITDTFSTSETTTLPANIVNLTLTGTTAINGTGNAQNNIITGNSANNTLDGGTGNDTLKGGAGNDIYLVDSVRDVVIENANEGQETIQSAVNNTLTDNVENLTLTGTANINGTGNALDNVITGNSGNNLLKGMNGNDRLLGGAGNDVLVGGAGNDQLTGGGGADQFLFGSGAAFSQTQFGADTITDFLKGTDKLVLSKLSFNILTSAVGGNLLATEFATINTTTNELTLAGASTAKIVYNAGTGNLFYNQNLATSGLGTGGLFASLTGTPNLGINDFLIQS